jgi:hypothetical protein
MAVPLAVGHDGGRLKIQVQRRSCVQFARQLRAALGEAVTRWDHPDTVEADEPLGRYCSTVTDADRVRWMSQPDELPVFLTTGIDELMTLAPAIDTVLVRFKKT